MFNFCKRLKQFILSKELISLTYLMMMSFAINMLKIQENISFWFWKVSKWTLIDQNWLMVVKSWWKHISCMISSFAILQTFKSWNGIPVISTKNLFRRTSAYCEHDGKNIRVKSNKYDCFGKGGHLSVI